MGIPIHILFFIVYLIILRIPYIREVLFPAVKGEFSVSEVKDFATLTWKGRSKFCV